MLFFKYNLLWFYTYQVRWCHIKFVYLTTLIVKSEKNIYKMYILKYMKSVLQNKNMRKFYVLWRVLRQLAMHIWFKLWIVVFIYSLHLSYLSIQE